MIEKLVTSRMRAKLLKLFLANIDNRYYLRELERMLDETLSPLRRQLLKLVKMGILITEYEGNLKYYRLNKNFEGIEDLRRLVLGREALVEAKPQTIPDAGKVEVSPRPVIEVLPRPRRIKYDAMVLTAVSLFVLVAAAFVVYTSTVNIKQVAGLISDKTMQAAEVTTQRITRPTRPDEMISRRWKILPGHVPVLSSGETGGRKRSEEL